VAQKKRIEAEVNPLGTMNSLRLTARMMEVEKASQIERQPCLRNIVSFDDTTRLVGH
jgi:hypothetical protein